MFPTLGLYIQLRFVQFFIHGHLDYFFFKIYNKQNYCKQAGTAQDYPEHILKLRLGKCPSRWQFLMTLGLLVPPDNAGHQEASNQR